MNSQKLRHPCTALPDTNTASPGAATPSRSVRTFLAITIAAALCALMPPSAIAQISPAKKWSADLGLLFQASGDVAALGFNIRASRYLNETNRLTLDIGYGLDLSSKVVGHFSYTKNGSSARHVGDYELKHDIAPLMLGWEHEWKTKNERLTWRLGPVVGAAFIDGKVVHNPSVNNVPNTFRSEGKVGFLGGVNAGLRWNFIPASETMYLDFSLAALGSNTVKFKKLKSYEFDRDANTDVNLSGGRMVIAFGLRF